MAIDNDGRIDDSCLEESVLSMPKERFCHDGQIDIDPTLVDLEILSFIDDKEAFVSWSEGLRMLG